LLVWPDRPVSATPSGSVRQATTRDAAALPTLYVSVM
jgi:hypothetical protein